MKAPEHTRGQANVMSNAPLSTTQIYPAPLVALLAVALLLAIAACGGDDDGGGSPTTSTDSGTATAKASAQPSGDATPTAAASQSTAAAEVQRLSKAFVDGVDGKVVYSYTSENVGLHPQGTWTTYLEGENRREDWINRPFNFDAISIGVDANGEYILCSGVAVSYSCNEAQEEDVQSIFGLFSPIREVYETLAGGTGSFEISALPDETIAGVSATCYQIDGDRIGSHRPGTESIKTCFAEDGTVLFLNRVLVFDAADVLDAELTVEATEVGSVTSADFDLLASG